MTDTKLSNLVKIYLSDAKWLLRLGLPLTITYFLMNLPMIVSVAFCGHLCEEVQDAAGLATSYLILISVCITFSTGYAVNGLFSQSYGSKNYKLLVSQLHRTLLVSTIIYFGFTLELFINCEYILVFFAPDRIVSRYARKFLLILIPGGLFR